MTPPRYTLADIRNIRREVREGGFRLVHDNVADLVKMFDSRKRYYEHLGDLLFYYLNADQQVTASCHIGPFLKTVAQAMAREATDGAEPEKGPEQEA